MISGDNDVHVNLLEGLFQKVQRLKRVKKVKNEKKIKKISDFVYDQKNEIKERTITPPQGVKKPKRKRIKKGFTTGPGILKPNLRVIKFNEMPDFLEYNKLKPKLE
jgi:hypothetical protein